MATEGYDDSKLYRVRVPTLIVVYQVLGLAMAIGLAALLAMSLLTMSARTAVPGRHHVFLSALVFVVFLVVAIFVAIDIVRKLLEMKRSSIRLDSDDLTYTDWRNRARTVPWSAVKSVRKWRLGGLEWIPLAVIQCDQGPIRMPFWLESSDAAIKEVVHRAGLAVSHKSWWVTTYESRPQYDIGDKLTGRMSQ